VSQETDRFFSDRGGAEPDRVGGRYQMPDPNTGQVRSFTSASNFAYPLIDQYGLTRWRHRQILIGLCARPDLVELLRVMVDPAGDVGKLDEIVSTALIAAGSTEAANRGTVLHEVARAVHGGQPYPAEYETFAQSYRSALARYGLRVVVAERRVVNPALGAAGQTDGILEECDGSMVVCDIKSTGHLDLAKHEISVQLAVYQGSSHIRDDADKGWLPIQPGQLREDYAVVIHVDRDSGAVALYRVDLRVGRHGANLAEELRGWRKSGPVLLPYVPPMTSGPRPTGGVALTDASGAEAEPAPSSGPMIGDTQVSADGTTELYTEKGWQVQPRSDELAPLAGYEATEAGASQPDDRYRDRTVEDILGPDEVRRQRPDVDDPGSVRSNTHRPDTLAPMRSAEDLMQPRVTKAEVQQYARQHGITDLAHTKKVLVAMLDQAGRLSPGNGAVAVTKDKDPAALPGPVPGLSDPTNPRDPAFRTTVLSKIANASGIAVLGQIWSYVRRQGGDQAWSDEMAEASKARAAELDAVVTNAGLQPVHDAFALIAAARSSHDLAEAWEVVTIGGSARERWTEEINQRAQERLAQIEAATPPAPANPFVGAS
jgi:hypothetical protein